MGFTDYLSRHPHSPASKISKDDEFFVVNRINEFNFTINDEFRRHELSANNNAAQKSFQMDDVINHAQNARTKQSAFCLNSTRVQLPSFNSFLNSSQNSFLIAKHRTSNFTQNPSPKIEDPISNPPSSKTRPNTIKDQIHAITRQNPNRNTSEVTIQKRYRAPNKNRMETTDKNSKSTQTDDQDASNIGKGREPIIEEKHQPLFQFAEEPCPEYKLQQVLGEAFLAEATAKDKNLMNYHQDSRETRLGRAQTGQQILLQHPTRLRNLTLQMPPIRRKTCDTIPATEHHHKHFT